MTTEKSKDFMDRIDILAFISLVVGLVWIFTDLLYSESLSKPAITFMIVWICQLAFASFQACLGKSDELVIACLQLSFLTFVGMIAWRAFE